MSGKGKSKIKIADGDDVKVVDRDAADGTAVNADREAPAEVDEATQLRRELDESRDKLLRAVAEQQNIRKRAANEVTEATRYANASLIKSLLSVIDDFERTLQQDHGESGSAVVEGVRLIHQNLLKILKDQSVERIDPSNEPFDPRFHEAMMQRPSENAAPGTILQTLQPGFVLHDRVLRPAKVIVAAEGKSTENCGSFSSTDDD